MMDPYLTVRHTRPIIVGLKIILFDKTDSSLVKIAQF
jgi:hypothetical protein